MGMATWTDVIDTTTGRIYASCADVERQLGIPVATVYRCIQTGEDAGGHCFDKVRRRAPDGVPKWAHAGEGAPAHAVKGERPAAPNSITTPEDRARAVEMYKRGVRLVDISAALGRSVETRDIIRWNGGVKPERPEGFWNHGRGPDITINGKRPSWEDPPSATVDGPEGTEGGDSSPA